MEVIDLLWQGAAERSRRRQKKAHCWTCAEWDVVLMVSNFSSYQTVTQWNYPSIHFSSAYPYQGHSGAYHSFYKREARCTLKKAGLTLISPLSDCSPPRQTPRLSRPFSPCINPSMCKFKKNVSELFLSNPFSMVALGSALEFTSQSLVGSRQIVLLVSVQIQPLKCSAYQSAFLFLEPVLSSSFCNQPHDLNTLLCQTYFLLQEEPLILFLFLLFNRQCQAGKKENKNIKHIYLYSFLSLL